MADIWKSDDGKIRLYYGDCRKILTKNRKPFVTSVVTDPPYGLKFMGKGWDHGVPGVEFWKAIDRVCKSGAPLLAFGGTRTHHRLMSAIEDSGWELRDCIMWVYGSGFPKSHNISKAIDKAAGAEREVVEKCRVSGGGMEHFNRTNAERHAYRPDGYQKGENVLDITAPATEAVKTWDGWGTALKPAYEPIILAMKPLDGTFARNALEHGVAGLNIDGSRVNLADSEDVEKLNARSGGVRGFSDSAIYGSSKGLPSGCKMENGRWPANLIHDGSDEVVENFPVTESGAMKHKVGAYEGESNTNFLRGDSGPQNQHGDKGSAARFFYCAKVSKSERTCRGKVENKHPTVKPITLMCYLLTLIEMPEENCILDPFMGSGSTALACIEKRLPFVGIDDDRESFDTAVARIRETIAEKRGISSVG